ncbi:cupin domain-containing protein [Shimia sp. SDUM112013]|uniref:cupin domain-containing protein n=1 Tax=Shimia sp. SDUM112013 TaxID=3136160 RepID=UPI0032EC8992
MSITDTVSPPNSGPPLHIHHDADETFVLLTDNTVFWLKGDRFARGLDQTVFVPRGKEHRFRVIRDVASRHLSILTPGGFEHFFAEMVAGQFRIPADMEHVGQITT